MAYCYPPDPNTRKPRFTPPAKSCDTHFHVFGPPEVFPFLSTHEYTPPAAPLEHYRKMLAVIGIERAVVVQPSVHGLDNSATLDAIKNSHGNFRKSTFGCPQKRNPAAQASHLAAGPLG